MRLVNASTHEIHEFLDDGAIPPFAILSHTWGKEECTLQQMTEPDVKLRAGYVKIKHCCDLALEHGLQWAWVDTCCIDKTSTAELSEAINSMFRWYQNAAICYAYLADVSGTAQIGDSRWFTRGWTLQELIAPQDLRFFSSNWQYLGSKIQLQNELAEITGIEQSVLETGVFEHINAARRMSWAAGRQTTRVEDVAYSLLGIFDVNMPLLYGEGKKSFTRLQEEIMKISYDHSLFAWGLPAKINLVDMFSDIETPPETSRLHRLLADSPAEFKSNHEIQLLEDTHSDMPPMVYSNGVRIELPVVKIGAIQFAAISCTVVRMQPYHCCLGIPLFQWSKKFTARCGEVVLLNNTYLRSSSIHLLIKAPILMPFRPITNVFKILPCIGEFCVLYDVYCAPHASYSPGDFSVNLPSNRTGPHIILFFKFITYPDNLAPWKGYPVEDHNSTFAIVIGGEKASKEGIWAVLVLIPSEPVKKNKEFVKLCVTERQLRSELDTNPPYLRNRQSHFQYLLHTWRCKGVPGTGREKHHLSLIVSVRESPLNLTEKYTLVHIDIAEFIKYRDY